MRAREAGLLGDILQGRLDPRGGRIGRDIDDPDPARKEPTGPDPGPVVGESPVVRLVPLGAEVKRVNDRPIGRARHVDIDGDDEVVIFGVGIHAEHIEIFLWPFESLDVRRQARLGRGDRGNQHNRQGC